MRNAKKVRAKTLYPTGEVTPSPGALAAEKLIGQPVKPLPSPVIESISLGTTAVTIWEKRLGVAVDYCIQNLSDNIVYQLINVNQPVASALRVPAGGLISKDNYAGDLIIVASAIVSDVRYYYQAHGLPWMNTPEGVL